MDPPQSGTPFDPDTGGLPPGDASTDVAAVFKATGWPQLDDDARHLHAEVITITAILVTADNPAEAVPATGAIQTCHSQGRARQRNNYP